jgi:hypothetical protein
MGNRRFTDDLLRCLTTRLTSARREDSAHDDRFADGAIFEQPLFESWTNHTFNKGTRFGIVETILGLSLKLRVLNVNRKQGDDAFANVFGRERHAFDLNLFRFDERAHGLDDCGVETVLVRSSRMRRDAVDVRPHRFIG